MSSPTRTAFSVLNTQRQLAKSLEATRPGTSLSDLPQRQARGSSDSVGPVERSLQNKLLAEIPSLASKGRRFGNPSKSSKESTQQLLSRLRKMAQQALVTGDLDQASTAPHNYTVLTEELLRIAAVRHENERQKSDRKVARDQKTNRLEQSLRVEQFESTPGENSCLDPLQVRTIRVDKDKIVLSKSGGGLIKRADIAPINLQSYCNETVVRSVLGSDGTDTVYIPLIEQLRKAPSTTSKSSILTTQSGFFKKLLD